MTIRAVLIPLFLVALGLACAGCENADAQAARAAFETMDAALDASDGETAVQHIADETFQYFDGIIRLALSGSAEEIKALPPNRKYDVIIMRNRCTAKELRAMDGRGWIVHATNQGWYAAAPGEESEWRVGRITAAHGAARGEIIMAGERTGEDWLFYNIDGVWKVDWRNVERVYDAWIEKDAFEWQQSVDSLILEAEDEDYGLTRTDLWEPMR